MTRLGKIRSSWKVVRAIAVTALIATVGASQAFGAFVVFEDAGSSPASITNTRDLFRLAVGGGTTAGANGDFGGVRREINWDGVGAGASDPNLMPGNQFAARGAVFGTPGTGFLVSTNAGGAPPPLFGFPDDFQAFSAQKLFTAQNSNIVDVHFFLPGTTIPATTTAFGLIFVDIETVGVAAIEFFDASGVSIFSRTALVAGNQGLTFLGAVGSAGEQIARVRITSGANTIVSNGVLGNPNDDVVVMDDFLYATPVPEPGSLSVIGVGIAALAFIRRVKRS